MATQWSYVMIHHSAGDDSKNFEIDQYRDWHVNSRGWDDIGYHFVVESVGGRYRAIAGRPLYMAGAHCPGMNNKAVGVCMAGNFDKTVPPEEQITETVRLVAGLCRLGRIDPDNIVGHGDYKATACPGKNVDLDKIRSLVRKELR